MKIKSREVTYHTEIEQIVFSDNSILILKTGYEPDAFSVDLTMTWLDKKGKTTLEKPAWATPEKLTKLLDKK